MGHAGDILPPKQVAKLGKARRIAFDAVPFAFVVKTETRTTLNGTAIDGGEKVKDVVFIDDVRAHSFLVVGGSVDTREGFTLRCGQGSNSGTAPAT